MSLQLEINETSLIPSTAAAPATAPETGAETPAVVAALSRRVRSRDGGMTLLEVLIVLALISLIAGTVGVTVFNNFKKGQVKAAKLNVKEVAGAVQQYMIDNNQDCPASPDELVNQKYMKKSNLKDPWGKQFLIKCPGEQDSDGVDITSSGPDRQEGTEDDINSWKL